MSYIIAATYRSGSSFLCESLSSTDLAGTPMEYFHRLNEPDIAKEDYLAFIRQTMSQTATSNGVFGVKLLWHHVGYLVAKARQHSEFRGPSLLSYQILSTLLSNPCYIRITRRDKLRQAISLYRARQTGVFHKRNGADVLPAAQPVYNERAIEIYLRKCQLDDLAWQAYFQTFGIVPFVVEYETFVKKREETVKEVLAFLDIPVPTPIRLPEARLLKTADDLNEEWRQRYLGSHDPDV